MAADEEVPLPGGHMNTVVRVGDTVRRTTGPWTPTIHALLRHIRANGFTLGPEPLGIDERGREILSFVAGETPHSPLPDWLFSDAMLDAVGRMVRAYHEAVRGFVAPPDAVWQLPAHEPVEVVCHNDIAPYNLVFDGERLTGVIDWDVASPGPRVWDSPTPRTASSRSRPRTTPTSRSPARPSRSAASRGSAPPTARTT